MASKDGKPLIIVYHADCVDGAACAWTVAKAHGVDRKPEEQKNVKYIPYAHHNAAAAEEEIRQSLKEGGQLYFVDVAPNRGFLDELMTPDDNGRAKVAGINVMDHHHSQVRDLKDYQPPAGEGAQPSLKLHLDSQLRSAAHMVWQDMMGSKPAPDVFEVIDRLDGAATGLITPQDFAAAAYVDTQDITTPAKAFETLKGLAKYTFNEIAAAGKSMLRDQEIKIDKLMMNLSYINLQVLPGQPEVPVAIVNADVKQFGRGISQRMTEEGQKAGSGVALAWFLQKNGAVTMSIRTSGNPDASAIAEHLRTTMGVTGGGHLGAGAVHFKSLFEFARQMPFAYASIPTPVASVNPPLQANDKPKTDVAKHACPNCGLH